MNTEPGRRGREGFAKAAKGNRKTFERLFRVLCETFASSASGSQHPIPNP